MDLKEEFKYRVDENKLVDAVNTAHFLANNFLETGRYNVDESWGPEGVLYLAESAYALMSMYEVDNDPLYTNAVKSILEALKKIQKISGGWALELGKSGVGFVVTEEERKITAEIEDLPPTVAALKIISDYEMITGDTSYTEMGNKAFRYLMEHWDSGYGSFREKENSKLMALRSNPRSYHLFSFLGIKAWRRFEPQVVDEILPTILNFIKTTFESYDQNTMPLVYGLHAAVLVQHSADEYIKNTIKSKIDNDLVFNETFRINNLPGAYGHRDGLRGIVKTEAHMRSGCGVAIAMKFYDLFTNTCTYRNSEEYKNLSNWIQNMRGKGFYYEFELLPERKKLGYGSPGQYLPIWWILGKI